MCESLDGHAQNTYRNMVMDFLEYLFFLMVSGERVRGLACFGVWGLTPIFYDEYHLLWTARSFYVHLSSENPDKFTPAGWWKESV